MIVSALAMGLFCCVVSLGSFTLGRKCGANATRGRAYYRGVMDERAANLAHVKETAELILKNWGQKVEAELMKGDQEKVHLSAVVDLHEHRAAQG